MGCKIERWSASASGAGSERVIRVSGDGECSKGGCKLDLELTNEGVIDDPDVVALSLQVDCSGIGPEVITPVHVETEVLGDPAIRVRIDTEDGSEFVEVSSG